ncbi:DUF535 family protein [Agrobacterium salinitolerans]|nr:DUF535 family protein [Agrobacterium salinitolerans]
MTPLQDVAVSAEKIQVTDAVARTALGSAHFLLFRKIMGFAWRAHWKRAVLFWMRFAANPVVTLQWWRFLADFSTREKLPPPHDELLQKPLSKFLVNKVSQKKRLVILTSNFTFAGRHFSRNIMAGLWAGKTIDMGIVHGRSGDYRCTLALADQSGGRHEGAFSVRLARNDEDAILWTATFTFLRQRESPHHTIVVGGMQGPRAGKEQMVSVTRDLAGLRPKEAALMVLQGLAAEGAHDYFAVAHSRHPIRYRRARRQKMMVSDIDAFWRERSGEPDEIFGFKVPFSSLEGGDKRSHMKLTFFNLGKRLAEARVNENA